MLCRRWAAAAANSKNPNPLQSRRTNQSKYQQKTLLEYSSCWLLLLVCWIFMIKWVVPGLSPLSQGVQPSHVGAAVVKCLLFCVIVVSCKVGGWLAGVGGWVFVVGTLVVLVEDWFGWCLLMVHKWCRLRHTHRHWARQTPMQTLKYESQYLWCSIPTIAAETTTTRT